MTFHHFDVTWCAIRACRSIMIRITKAHPEISLRNSTHHLRHDNLMRTKVSGSILKTLQVERWSNQIIQYIITQKKLRSVYFTSIPYSTLPTVAPVVICCCDLSTFLSLVPTFISPSNAPIVFCGISAEEFLAGAEAWGTGGGIGADV